MEHGLRLQTGFMHAINGRSLNPCYNGTWSPTGNFVLA